MGGRNIQVNVPKNKYILTYIINDLVRSKAA